MLALQCCLLVTSVILSVLISSLYVIFTPPNLPDVNQNIWWGNYDRSLAQPEIRKFKINVSTQVKLSLKINQNEYKLINNF